MAPKRAELSSPSLPVERSAIRIFFWSMISWILTLDLGWARVFLILVLLINWPTLFKMGEIASDWNLGSIWANSWVQKFLRVGFWRPATTLLRNSW